MLRCSHVLCKVDDIHAAARDYRDLGFTVELGAAEQKAHNALIWFEDGPFIELFELSPRFSLLRWPFGLAFGAAAGDRLARWAKPGEGWRDLAVETDDLQLHAVRSDLRAAGISVSRVMKGKRTKQEGQPVRYQFLAARPVDLPFVVSAYDPPQKPKSIAHANGANGISRVRVGVVGRDRAAFQAIADTSRWFAIEQADQTGVLGVELDGLTAELDPGKLHGAILSPARSPR